MIRTVVFLLAAFFAATFLRAFINLVSKFVTQLFQPSAPGQTAGQPPAGGELKQCSNCGVYSSRTSSIERTIGGKTHYFCSPACRDRYQA